MNNSPTILVLDAGGTNLVFNAVQHGQVTGTPVILPAPSENLETFLQKIIAGFKTVNKQNGSKAKAISFCFPGPADYENGIIGNLENLPFFRGGVPLKKILEHHFNIPVYINNDGDLFTLGEALGGILPEINRQSKKQYKNLLGVTLGTGFGGGIVINNKLLPGDNSAAAEINRMSSIINRNQSVEEVLSIRGIRKLYAEKAEIDVIASPEPFDLYQIALGDKTGNQKAAINAWDTFSTVLADAIANAITLTDSNVVIGGGLSGAHPLFLPKTVELLNGYFTNDAEKTTPRLEINVFNWHDPEQRRQFLENQPTKIAVPYSDEVVEWDSTKKVTVAVSTLGTSEAVALGAYHFAMNNLSAKQ